MPHHLDRMAEELVKAKLENYWPGFELLPMPYMTEVMFIYSIILNSVTIHHVHIIF
ncbi:hypothetical protein AB1L12_19345 [Peribacillus frigoritolerans]|uniref:hypothetical protein n=1 Tax=Peribacillus frigoritolerans TaxID=450367 RepID=UPI0039A13688